MNELFRYISELGGYYDLNVLFKDEQLKASLLQYANHVLNKEGVK